MIKKVDNKEIMTSREAMERYKEYYIGFVTTEQNLLDPDNEIGYITFLMDNYDEGYSIPRRTDNNKFVSIIPGYAVGGTEIGGIYLDV